MVVFFRAKPQELFPDLQEAQKQDRVQHAEVRGRGRQMGSKPISLGAGRGREGTDLELQGIPY